MKCPICHKTFAPEAPGAALPFCSKRCKMIDAKRWLGEEYSVERLNVDELEKEIVQNEQNASVRPPETN